VDLAKYRNLFLEEATEHLAEISRALLDLEKDPSRGEAIDLVFRMAHSIKGMAGSLDFASITELAHAVEDRMDRYRAAGRVDAAGGLPLLFRGLEGLERQVAAVRETGEPGAPDPELLALLRGAPEPAAREAAESRPKKAPRRP
jgi:two-component system, chemotaxis family, sensor kinase CheA